MPDNIAGRLKDFLGEEKEEKGKKRRKRYPILPDGTKYTGIGGEEEELEEAQRILDNLNSAYLLGREHSHLIRLILDAYMRMRKLKETSDPRLLQELRYLEAHVMSLSDGLGLIQKHKPTDTPYDYIEMLRNRAEELIREKGIEKTIACPDCGKIILTYLGRDHPFLSDREMVIWSPEVREMMNRSCECGRPKLTLEEAAYILRLPAVGMSQLIQEAEGKKTPDIVEEEEVEEDEENEDREEES